MTLVTNNFEGGSDGTTITTGNSGGASGTAFDGVSRDATGTPGVVAFSNVQARAGALSGRFQVGSVTAITAANWSTARGTITDDFVRAYFYLTSSFTLNMGVIKWYSAALANYGSILWGGAGANKLSILNNVGASIAGPSTTVLSLNAWHRLEAHHFADTAAAQTTLRIFAGVNVNGTTPDETLTSTTYAGPTTSTGRVDIGCAAAGGASEPSSSGFLYADDIVAGGTDWIGPVAVTGGAPVAPIMMWP